MWGGLSSASCSPRGAAATAKAPPAPSMAGTRAPRATPPALPASSLPPGTREHSRVPLPLTWARGHPGKALPSLRWDGSGDGERGTARCLGRFASSPARGRMAQQQPREGLQEGEAGWDFAERALGDWDLVIRAQYSHQSLVPSRCCGMCGAGVFSQYPTDAQRSQEPVAGVEPSASCTVPGACRATPGAGDTARSSLTVTGGIPSHCTTN